MSVSVRDVLNDPSSTALDERDAKDTVPQAIEVMLALESGRRPLADSMDDGQRRG